MSLRTVIRHRGRRVYAVWTDRLTDVPIQRELWWLLDTEPGMLEEGSEATLSDGRVHAKRVAPFSSGVQVGLLDPKTLAPSGGNAQAEFVEETPVPLPKIRKGIETRWYQGRWQKYIASKGWVSA